MGNIPPKQTLGISDFLPTFNVDLSDLNRVLPNQFQFKISVDADAYQGMSQEQRCKKLIDPLGSSFSKMSHYRPIQVNGISQARIKEDVATALHGQQIHRQPSGSMLKTYIDFSNSRADFAYFFKGQAFQYLRQENSNYVFTSLNDPKGNREFKISENQVQEYTGFSPQYLQNYDRQTQLGSVVIPQLMHKDFVSFQASAVITTNTFVPTLDRWEDAKLSPIAAKTLSQYKNQIRAMQAQLPANSIEAEYLQAILNNFDQVKIVEAYTQPIHGIPAVYQDQQNLIVFAKDQINLFLLLHELGHSIQDFSEAYFKLDTFSYELEVYQLQIDIIFKLAGVSVRQLTELIASIAMQGNGPSAARLCLILLRNKEFNLFAAIEKVLKYIDQLSITDAEKISLKQLTLARVGFRATKKDFELVGGNQIEALITPLYKNHTH